jgi:hypothetical protein
VIIVNETGNLFEKAIQKAVVVSSAFAVARAVDIGSMFSVARTFPVDSTLSMAENLL